MNNTINGFTCSTFDLFHAGHVAMLEWCRSRCDHLIVGLQYDPSLDRDKNKPIQSIVERTVQLRGCKYVDEILVYTTEAELEHLIVGEEYTDKDFTGKDLCSRLGIEIHYNKRAHPFSSSELRQRAWTAEQIKVITA